MFVHAVYFWLKRELGERETRTFLDGLHALAAIETVQHGFVGVPADTDRPVIDRSYSYALVVVFRDQAGHERYQDHPVHDRFRADCATYWERVQIYDSVPPQ